MSEIKDIRDCRLIMIDEEVERFFGYVRDKRTNKYLEQLVIFFQSNESEGSFYVPSSLLTQHNGNHEDVRKYMLDNYNVNISFEHGDKGFKMIVTLTKDSALKTTFDYKGTVITKPNSYYINRMSANAIDISYEIRKVSK